MRRMMITRTDGTTIWISCRADGAFDLEDSRMATPVLGLDAEELSAYLRASDCAIEVLS